MSRLKLRIRQLWTKIAVVYICSIDLDDESNNAEIDVGVPNNVKYKQVKVEIS
jgi:hypothetical protein